MRFLSREEVRPWFESRTVAVVGSGPGVLENAPGFIDSHDVVVRCNNYRIMPPMTGLRTDCFYSFYGSSIRKTREELQADGVKLCMSKTPNADCSGVLPSEWHRRNNKMIGVDYRPHYTAREKWWFCDVYVPTVEVFMEKFELIGRHQPTTGFSAILDVLSFEPKAVYLTGFDFFASGIHNVNEPWLGKGKNEDDPIKHVPEAEAEWLRQNIGRHPITTDRALARRLATA